MDVLRDGIATGSTRIPYQSSIEFVVATTRGGPGDQLLDAVDASREAEELMAQFPIIYPDDAVLRTALRGAAAYGLSWFDAHISLHVSPRGEVKCVRGSSGRGASRLARAGVLKSTSSTASKCNEVMVVVSRAPTVMW